MGAVVAVLVLIASMVFDIANGANLAVTCLISLTAVTVIAGTFGALVPFILKALKFDPAVATGIFITTANDVFGVLIFFSMASVFYL